MSEETTIKAELFEKLEEPYRPPFALQVALEVIVVIVAIGICWYLKLSLDISALIVVIIATFFYPIFIKVRNKLSESIGFGLSLASVVGILVYIAQNVDVLVGEGELFGITPNLAMLIIFAEIIGIELLQHVSWRLKRIRNWISYAVYGVLTGVFFVAILSFCRCFWPETSPWPYVVSLVLSGLFFYAILPEEFF